MTDFPESVPLLAPIRLDNVSLETLFTGAATANSFASTPVTPEELRSIWDLAKWAPTSGNFQPMRVLFVQSSEGRAKLGELMKGNNREKTIAAPAVAVLAFDRFWNENVPTTSPHLAHLAQSYAENENSRLDSARNNSWLQAAYFILAIRALGLAAGPMLGFDTTAINTEFFADGRWGALLVVNIGHPTEGSYRPRMPRLDPSETVRFA